MSQTLTSLAAPPPLPVFGGLTAVPSLPEDGAFVFVGAGCVGGTGVDVRGASVGLLVYLVCALFNAEEF